MTETHRSQRAGEPERVVDWLADASQQMAVEADGHLRLELEWLLADTLGVPRSRLYAEPSLPIPAHCRLTLAERLARRASGEPLAYLLGYSDFYGLRIELTPDVLIPRAATESLVESALARLAGRRLRVLDAGTGSGAVALALAAHSQACITASDRSFDALKVAERNATRLAMSTVQLVCANWLDAFAPASFDMIVSNPPYIGSTDADLDTVGLGFEPRDALISGPDGLDAIRALIGSAPRIGAAGCQLLIEHGYRQGPAVRALLYVAGFVAITTGRDLAGHERVTLGRLP